jgi:hypothetical protein
MGAPLEIAGPLKRTEKGNVDWYYGGGDIGWVNAAAACHPVTGVPLPVRPGKTVGIIEGNKVVEHYWPVDDVSDSALQQKTLDLDVLDVGYLTAQGVYTRSFFMSDTRVVNGSGTMELDGYLVCNFDLNGTGIINITGISDADINQVYIVTNKGAFDAQFLYSANLLLPFERDFVLVPGSSVIIKMQTDTVARVIFSTYGYSSNDFTQAYKDKIDSLREHYRGKYTTLSALQAVHGIDGDYALLDTGSGNDATEYIWDNTDSKWVPSTNTAASSFAQLAGSPADNTALGNALAAAANRINHTGQQPASTISDFNNAVLLSVLTGLSFADSNAIAANDNIRAALGKLQAQINANSTAIGTKLTGTPATDAETQIIATVTEDNKFVSRLKLFNWGEKFKTLAATISGNWNFTGTLKKDGYDVLTTYNTDISTKLNVEGNTTLTGDEGGVALLSASGKIIRNAFFRFTAVTRELAIGAINSPGKLSVYNNSCIWEVGDNIADNQTFQRLNPNQEQAMQVVDKTSIPIYTISTAAGNEYFLLKARVGYDRRVGLPAWRDQASISVAGAGTRVYGLKADGTPLIIKLDTDTQSIMLSARFKVSNATGSIIIAQIMTVIAKRVNGVISFSYGPATLLSDNGASGYSVGLETTPDNLGIRLFFQTGGSDATAYTGGFGHIEYVY